MLKYVRLGKIGVSPQKPRPVGQFNKTEYEALKFAFLSFIKLEQTVGKSQSTIKSLGLRVKAMVNHTGRMSRNGDDLATRLKQDVADEIDVNKTKCSGTSPDSLDHLWKSKNGVWTIGKHGNFFGL